MKLTLYPSINSYLIHAIMPETKPVTFKTSKPPRYIADGIEDTLLVADIAVPYNKRKDITLFPTFKPRADTEDKVNLVYSPEYNTITSLVAYLSKNGELDPMMPDLDYLVKASALLQVIAVGSNLSKDEVSRYLKLTTYLNLTKFEASKAIIKDILDDKFDDSGTDPVKIMAINAYNDEHDYIADKLTKAKTLSSKVYGNIAIVEADHNLTLIAKLLVDEHNYNLSIVHKDSFLMLYGEDVEDLGQEVTLNLNKSGNCYNAFVNDLPDPLYLALKRALA